MKLFAVLGAIKNWVLAWAIMPLAPVVLFCNAFAEAILFPVPPDLLLIAMCLGSVAANVGWLCFVWALVCTAGSVMGGVGGYFIGLKGGRPIAERLYNKEKIAAADKLYGKYSVWAVAIAGFTPVPYCIFTVLSGALRMRLPLFVLVSILSRGARFFLVAALIFLFGEPVRRFLENDRLFGIATLAFMVLLAGGYFALHQYSKRHARGMREAALQEADGGK